MSLVPRHVSTWTFIVCVILAFLLGNALVCRARLYPVRLPQGGIADHCAGLAAPDLLVVAGGQAAGNSLSASVVVFNLTSTTVSVLPSLSVGRYLIACGLASGEFAIFGGSTSATAPVYTAAIDRYLPRLGQKLPTLRNLSGPRQYLGFGTSGVAGGTGIARPVVAGGYTYGQYLGLVEDTAGVENATLRQPRDGLVAVSYVTAGNHTLTAFAGGATPTTSAVTDIDLLNATSGRLVLPLGGYTLSQARLMLCAVVTSDGRHVLYIGGRNATGYATDTIDVVDTQTNGIIWLAHLLTPRERCSAAAYGPYVYVAGGQANLSTMLDSVEIIDTRDWSVFALSSAPLPNASTAMAAVSVPGVGAVFIGGFNAVDFLATLVVYSCGDGIIYGADEVCDGSPFCTRDCASCTNNLTACPLPGNTTTDCIDTRFALQHCGICTNNCSALPNIEPNVTCFYGSCFYWCPIGRSDCDKRPENGCEIDDTLFQTDPTNCNGCSISCSNLRWPNVATTSCTNGACGIATCVAPWLDCDGLWGTGCEANPFNDTYACGGCSLRCTPADLGWPHVAATTCVGGICRIAQCVAGYADCDLSRLNGCEQDIWSSVTSCGACMRDCSVTPGWAHVALYNCTGSVDLCIIYSCDDGWSNENANSSDGCEYHVAGPVAVVTPPPQPTVEDIWPWWWIILIVVLVLVTAGIVTAILVRRKQLRDRKARAAAAVANKAAETMGSNETNQ